MKSDFKRESLAIADLNDCCLRAQNKPSVVQETPCSRIDNISTGAALTALQGARAKVFQATRQICTPTATPLDV